MKRRLKSLVVAVGIAVAVGGVSAPALAKPNNGGSGDKKSCTGSDGEQYTHGSVFVTYIRVGGKLHTAYTYKCNDGKWESVSVRVGPTGSAVSQFGAVLVR